MFISETEQAAAEFRGKCSHERKKRGLQREADAGLTAEPKGEGKGEANLLGCG
jgi:ribosomal protein L15E